MEPSEYADWKSQLSIKAFVDKINSIAQNGLQARYCGGVIEYHIVDMHRFRQYWAERGATPEMIDINMEFIKSGKGHKRFSDFQDMCSRLGKLGIMAARDGHERLSAVPIKVGAEPFVNGYAKYVPKGGDCIIINFALEHLLYWIGVIDVLTDAYIRKDDRVIDLSQSMNKYASMLLGSRVTETDLPVWAIEEWLRGDTEITWMLYMYSLLFILLHEYGHIQCGHTDKQRKGKLLRPSESQEWEYEADKFAADSFRDGLSKIRDICLKASWCVFSLLNYDCRKNQKSSNDEYPPIRERLERVLIRIGGETEARPLMERFDQFFSLVDECERRE